MIQESEVTIDGAAATEVVPFTSGQFGQLRTVSDDGQVLFCGKDAATALGYANPSDALAKHTKGVAKRYPLETDGGIQQVRFITEPDLYRLITHSKLPAAQKFEAWVFEEILPSIRKHGAYMTEQTIEQALASPDFLIKLATELKTEQEARKRLEAETAKQQQEMRRLEPKAHAWTVWLSTNADYKINAIAKALHKAGATALTLNGRGERSMGQNNLMEWLRQNAWIGSRDNAPLQKRVNQSYMTAKLGGYTNPKTGEQVGTCTPRITARGAARLAELFQVMPETVMDALNEDREAAE